MVKIAIINLISGEINYIDLCESNKDQNNHNTWIYNSLSEFHHAAYLITEPEDGTLQELLVNNFKYNRRGTYQNGKIYYTDIDKVASYDIFTGEIIIDSKEDENTFKLNYCYECNDDNVIITNLNNNISKVVTLDMIKESSESVKKILSDGNYSVDYSETIMREFDNKLYFTICIRDSLGNGYDLLIHYDFDNDCFEYCDYGNDETYEFPILILEK